MRFILVLVLLVSTADASGFKMGGIGGGGGNPNPDCGELKDIEQELPDWSRFSWSWSLGWTARSDHTDWDRGAAVVAQASWQFLAHEKQCRSGSGLFSSDAWRRLSLAWSLDVAWRNLPDDPIDLRPGVHFARSTYDIGFLNIGSPWVPSYELAVTLGPTFSPQFSGVAASVQGRLGIFTVEIRGGWRSETNGGEVMLLFGLTDLHGLVKLGPKRETI